MSERGRLCRWVHDFGPDRFTHHSSLITNHALRNPASHTVHTCFKSSSPVQTSVRRLSHSILAMVYNTLGVFAGLSGAVGVGLGALGAHAMKSQLNAYRKCLARAKVMVPVLTMYLLLTCCDVNRDGRLDNGYSVPASAQLGAALHCQSSPDRSGGRSRLCICHGNHLFQRFHLRPLPHKA